MASPSPRRIILVGCGAIARQWYVPALRALQNAGLARVAAIVDPAVNARESVARSFPRAGQSARLEQTTAPESTLAILASPPGVHAAQAVAAFERGWHVLCETPLASTVEEAELMIAAAQKHQRLLAVGLQRRFFSSSRVLHSLCHDWQLGAPVSFTIREGGPFRWPASPSFFDRTQTRGGVLFDLGVQVFDLLGWWFGEPTDLRYADDAMGGLEANAFVQLRYDRGLAGRVHLSRDWATAQQYRFVFERGVVTWTVDQANALTVQLGGTPAALGGTLLAPLTDPPALGKPQPLESSVQCFILQLANVIAATQGEELLRVSGEEALASLRLVDRCYAHRTLVEQPWLTPDEIAQAREACAVASALP